MFRFRENHLTKQCTRILFAAAALTAVCAFGLPVMADNNPVGTTFTYQGRLLEAGEPVSGTVDLHFRLFDAPDGGDVFGDLEANDLEIGDDGRFTIDLDFGDVFDGGPRWLEIHVNGTPLSPRQPIMAAPHAMVATTAANVPTKAVVGSYAGITGVGTLDSLNVSGNTGIGVNPYPNWRMSIETSPNDNLGGLWVHQKNPSDDSSAILAVTEGTGSAAILGTSQANTGEGVGIFGSVNSPDGYAGFFTGPAGSRNFFQRNVGIGILNPGAPLHVASGNVGATVHSNATGVFERAGNNYLQLLTPAANERGILFGDDENLAKGGIVFNAFAAPDGLQFRTGGNTTRMTVTENGNVGIGTTNPQNRLHIVSATGTGVRGVSNSAGGYGGSFGDLLGPGHGILVTKESHLLDRVGVGTTSPNSKLHVNSLAGENPLRVQRSGATKLLVHDNGNVTIGSAITPQDTLHVAGTTRTNVIRIMGGSDLAERFDVADVDDLTPQPGMVLCIDPANPGKLIPSTRAYDRTVAGVISGANGINSGMIMGQEGTEADGQYPVALTGRVYVMVDATNGALEPGDMLTTSDRPGHAMKVNDFSRSQGAIIGKAMSSLAEGEVGYVLVLINLQ